MGVRGAKKSEAAVEEQGAVVAALAPLGEITSRSQFGGYGIFIDGKMFGLVSSDGVLHLKADATTADDYPPGARFGKMPYYRVPAEVRQDPDALRDWAGRAIAVARSA